jgi:hypothetical protein
LIFLSPNFNLHNMRKFLLWCMVLLSIGVTAQMTVTIGAGANTASAGTNGDPIYRSSGTSSYHYSKSVQLLTASDLSAAGILNSYPINSIGYYKTTANNVSGANAWTLNVYLKNSSATALASGTSWSTMTTGATLFYSATIDSSNNFPSAAGWVTFTNNTGNAFTYTGGAIEVYIDWVPAGTLSTPFTGGGFQWKYDTTSTVQAMGTSNSSSIAGTTTSYTTNSRRYQTQVTFTAPPCTGTPAPGNTLATVTSTACSSPYSTTLSLQNPTLGSGVTYQWYDNSGAISGATNSSYIATVSAANSFYCAVTCSGATTNSTPVSVSAPAPPISSFPWTENFDTMNTIGNGILPSCWATSGGLNASYLFTTQNAGSQTYNDPRSTPNYMTIYYPTTAAYLWAPLMNLTAGQSYDFTFYWVGDGTSGWQGDVLVNNAQSSTGATTLSSFIIPSQTSTGGSNSTNYTKAKVTFVPNTTGSYSFGIKSTATTSAPFYMGFDDFSVTLTPSCTEPTAVSASNVTSSEASVSWTAPATAPGNGYDLYYSTSNTAPISATNPNYLNITGTSQLVNNLTPATTYYVWVRSHCSTSDVSPWSNMSSFTTLCVPVTSFPWTENFDAMNTIGNGILPSCWATSGGLNASYMFTTQNAASQSYNDPRSAPNYMTIYYPTTTAYLWAPPMNLTAGQSYDFTFYWVGDGTSGWEGDVLVNNAQSSTGATTLTNFITSSQTSTGGSNSTNYTKVKATFVPNTTGSYSFGIKSTATTSAPFYMGFDDFSVMLTPSCIEPTAVSASNVTSSEALVSWTAPATAPANGYDLYYSTSNAAPISATNPSYLNITGTSQLVNNLAPATTYYVWVRSQCSNSTTSEWSNMASFTTACVAVQTLTQNFDTTTVGTLPPCWSSIGTNASYARTYASTAISSPNALYIYNDGTSTGVGMASTPEISNLQSGNYVLKFKGRANFTAGGVVEIGYLSNPSDTSTFVSIGSYTTTSTTTIDDYSLDITGIPAGVNKLVLRHTGVPANSVLIDDVSYEVNANLSTNDVRSKDNIKVYPNPFSDVLNISDASNVKNVLVTDLSGRLLKTIANPGAQIYLSDLKQGLYLISLEMKDGSKQTLKAIKK